MAFEDLKAELGILLERVNDESEDRMELYERLHEMLNEMRAFGMPMPDDLKVLEMQLKTELFGSSDDSKA
ncbi:MAG: hypothetical protein ACKVH7_04020 [Alphaproteobacteria bacterium]|jgi:hypothetical protein